MSVGLALSAGGASGEPWHAGVLAALHDVTGWDARQADLIIGTSAGAITGLGLRTGISARDRYAAARGEAMTPVGRALLDRIVTPYTEDNSPRRWRPLAPGMTLRSLWPPWSARLVHAAVGLVPEGGATTDAMEQRLRELHPGRWPADRFWVTAVRVDDGRRVVFGRDDVKASVAQAVRASCAVPVRYEPVPIGIRRYVDGGVHSSTNADLLAPLGFDVAVVSSVMTATSDALEWMPPSVTRTWMARRLAQEVAAIRRRGTPVLVLQPDRGALDAMQDGDARALAEHAHQLARTRLEHRDGAAFATWLERAAATMAG